MENNQQSFWQFSDQLRVHKANMANLSLNDSIWSCDYPSKRPDDRKNFDARVGGWGNSSNTLKAVASDLNCINKPASANVGKDLNGFNFSWKNDLSLNGVDDGWKFNNFVTSASQMKNVNGGFNKGVYSSAAGDYQTDMNLNGNVKGMMTMKKKVDNEHGGKGGHKKSNNRKNSNDGGYSNDWKLPPADKRFKTLPPAEALPRNETVGGYIFVCNNDTMEENLQRQLFGLPPRYRDSVRQITPGLPLFLYNYSNHQLHGIFEAASFGGSNIDPTAWEDKKCPGESRFPAQVRVVRRKVYEALEEDSFRPILHHYDGPKFRLELNVPEALSLLDEFAVQE